MFQSVMVPLDGTTFSERSLPFARMVGRTPSTRLHLVSVQADDAPKDGYLRNIANSLREDRIDVDQAVVGGRVTHALEEYAKTVGADLIVMATHGRGGVDRLRLGSVAESLVTRGVAPILLFHPDPNSPSSQKIERVVVALDSSAQAQGILDPVAELGQAVGVSSYTLVHVKEDRGAGKAGWSPASALQLQAQESMAPIRDRLGADGAEVDVRVVTASRPSDGILEVAWDVGADLIAMTTHGMTGLRPTLMGSVAADVLHRWHGPLLLRRPEA